MRRGEHGGDWAAYQIQYHGMPLDFSANVSPMGIPAGVKRALYQAVEEVNRYPDPLCRQLRACLGLHWIFYFSVSPATPLDRQQTGLCWRRSWSGVMPVASFLWWMNALRNFSWTGPIPWFPT